MLIVLNAWRQHHAKSKTAAELLVKHIRAHGWQSDEAAIHMGISPSQFSRQIQGREGLSFWRALLLPDRIVLGWLDELVASYTEDVLEDLQFQRLVVAFRRFARQHRSVAKAELETSSERRRA